MPTCSYTCCNSPRLSSHCRFFMCALFDLQHIHLVLGRLILCACLVDLFSHMYLISFSCLQWLMLDFKYLSSHTGEHCISLPPIFISVPNHSRAGTGVCSQSLSCRSILRPVVHRSRFLLLISRDLWVSPFCFHAVTSFLPTVPKFANCQPG